MASVLRCVFGDLVDALKTVVPENKIFLGDRPSLSEGIEPLGTFAVIELPVSIEDLAIGNKKFVLQTMGVIYLFNKCKKDRTVRINDLSDSVDSVVGLFPISGSYCVAADPSVLLRGSDGTGYHVTTITFYIHTRAGVFNS